MRAPAILLAIPLTVGCALGLADLHEHRRGCAWGAQSADVFAACAAAAAVLALIGCVGALAAENEGAPSATVCLVAGAFVVGLSLGAMRRSAPIGPPLYVWFAPAHPDARPVVLRGSLREDATLTATGVSLVLDVREIEPCVTGGPAATRRFTIHGLTPSCATRGGVQAVRRRQRWRPARWGSGAPAAPCRCRPHAARADDVSESGRAGRAAGAGAPRHRARRLGQERRDGGGRSAPGSRRGEWASAFRAWVRSVLSATVAPWSARSAGVAAAIVIGDRTGLAQDDEERLQAAGTYHVIAISGGNIAILTLLLVGAAGWLGASPRVGAAATVVVLLAYGQVTGPAPSVDRAISAAVLFLAGRLIDLRGPSINILAVAATLGLSLSPMAVFDPGLSPVLWRDAWHPDWRPESGVSSDAGRRCRRAQRIAHESRGAFAARPDAPSAGIAAGPGPPARIAVATIVAATVAAEVAWRPSVPRSSVASRAQASS